MPVFPPGTLWQCVERTSQSALRQGALQPIRTEFEFLEDGGIRFLVRVVENLERKARDNKSDSRPGGPRNPFLPYDPGLYVADAGPDHVCLLNKFNVVDHHLLIVTRHFEHQETPLNERDFAAWWHCLKEYDSLGFYNAGTVAGASQSHKHMQLVPLPLADSGPSVPIEPTLAALDTIPRLNPCPRLGFRHAAVCLETPPADTSPTIAALLHRHYREMLALIDLPDPLQEDVVLAGAYNLLLTRRWMLLVPRSHEHFAGISLNAMAYAGALLTRDRAGLDALRRLGPMAALRHGGLA